MGQSPETYNDGIVEIYRVSDSATAGNAPIETHEKLGVLRYRRRTVGVKRQYMAMQANARIDLLLRCPYRPEVSVLDVAIPTLDSRQYRITAVQVPESIWPPAMDLTLERLEVDYDLPG